MSAKPMLPPHAATRAEPSSVFTGDPVITQLAKKSSTSKYSAIASKVKTAKRPPPRWSKMLKDEVQSEAILAAATEANLYLSAKQYIADIRHKLSWEWVRNAVVNAFSADSVRPLNNVLALTGRMDIKRITTLDEVGTTAGAALGWIHIVADSVPNVFWGDGKINRKIGSSLDLHSLDDPLGQSTHSTSSVNATPQSKSLKARASDLPQLLNGALGLSSSDLYDIWQNTVEHYKRLEAEATTQKLTNEAAIFRKRAAIVKYPHSSWLDKKSQFRGT